MIARLTHLLLAAGVTASLGTPLTVASTQDTTPHHSSVDTAVPHPVAFEAGEQLTYDVAVGGARVGTGHMTIVGMEPVRGHDTYHAIFDVSGGIIFYHVHDKIETWFDPLTMTSHRFIQQINEGGYHKERSFEIFPDRGIMQQAGIDEDKPTVSNPLDDASFIYFVRTVPLEVGQTYVYDRYFRPEKNPVIVKVLRKERVKVPAGTFDAIVVQPIIKAGGLFAEGGEALMWFSDDDRRILLQMKTKIPVLKTLDLYLKSYTPSTSATSGR